MYCLWISFFIFMICSNVLLFHFNHFISKPLFSVFTFISGPLSSLIKDLCPFDSVLLWPLLFDQDFSFWSSSSSFFTSICFHFYFWFFTTSPLFNFLYSYVFSLYLLYFGKRWWGLNRPGLGVIICFTLFPASPKPRLRYNIICFCFLVFIVFLFLIAYIDTVIKRFCPDVFMRDVANTVKLVMIHCTHNPRIGSPDRWLRALLWPCRWKRRLVHWRRCWVCPLSPKCRSQECDKQTRCKIPDFEQTRLLPRIEWFSNRM